MEIMLALHALSHSTAASIPPGFLPLVSCASAMCYGLAFLANLGWAGAPPSLNSTVEAQGEDKRVRFFSMVAIFFALSPSLSLSLMHVILI